MQNRNAEARISFGPRAQAGQEGKRTRLGRDDALAILLEDADLAPAIDLDPADGDLGEVFANEGLDDVSDVIVAQRRVGRQPHLDCGDDAQATRDGSEDVSGQPRSSATGCAQDGPWSGVQSMSDSAASSSSSSSSHSSSELATSSAPWVLPAQRGASPSCSTPFIVTLSTRGG
jgi:hypothetical protein